MVGSRSLRRRRLAFQQRRTKRVQNLGRGSYERYAKAWEQPSRCRFAGSGKRRRHPSPEADRPRSAKRDSQILGSPRSDPVNSTEARGWQGEGSTRPCPRRPNTWIERRRLARKFALTSKAREAIVHFGTRREARSQCACDILSLELTEDRPSVRHTSMAESCRPGAGHVSPEPPRLSADNQYFCGGKPLKGEG